MSLLAWRTIFTALLMIIALGLTLMFFDLMSLVLFIICAVCFAIHIVAWCNEFERRS